MRWCKNATFFYLLLISEFLACDICPIGVVFMENTAQAASKSFSGEQFFVLVCTFRRTVLLWAILREQWCSQDKLQQILVFPGTIHFRVRLNCTFNANLRFALGLHTKYAVFRHFSNDFIRFGADKYGLVAATTMNAKLTVPSWCAENAGRNGAIDITRVKEMIVCNRTTKCVRPMRAYEQWCSFDSEYGFAVSM